MKQFLQFVVVASLLGLVAAPASAQTGALVSGTLEIWQPGATAPFMSSPFTMATQGTCNIAAPASPTIVFNPVRFYFTDPVNVGKVCLVTAGTFLASVPVIPGPYTATITVTNDYGMTSVRSAPSPPFYRGTPVVMVAPSGVTVIGP